MQRNGKSELRKARSNEGPAGRGVIEARQKETAVAPGDGLQEREEQDESERRGAG